MRATIRGLVADTRPLRNEHFRRLWLANIITVIGAQLTVVAVPAQIYADDRLVGVRRADRRSSGWCRWWSSACGAARWPTSWTGARS